MYECAVVFLSDGKKLGRARRVYAFAMKKANVKESIYENDIRASIRINNNMQNKILRKPRERERDSRCSSLRGMRTIIK